MSTTSRGTPVWSAVTWLASSAALLLGTIYALGAAVESRRLANAHVSVTDALPRIPLAHLLAEGISLLFSTALIVAAVSVVVGLLWWAEPYLDSFREHVERHTRTVRTSAIQIRSSAASTKGEIEARIKAIADAQRLVKEMPMLEVAPKSEEERTALRARIVAAEAVLAEYKKSEETPEMMLKRITTLRRTNKRTLRRYQLEAKSFRVFVWIVRCFPLLLAATVGVFAAPPLVGLGLAVAGSVWYLRKKTPIRRLLAILYFAVVMTFVANSILWVRALPIADVNTTNSNYAGTLVSLTDSAWYVAVSQRETAVVPTSEVVTGTYRVQVARRQLTLFELLI